MVVKNAEDCLKEFKEGARAENFRDFGELEEARVAAAWPNAGSSPC
jgi:hypothetical protein